MGEDFRDLAALVPEGSRIHVLCEGCGSCEVDHNGQCVAHTEEEHRAIWKANRDESQSSQGIPVDQIPEEHPVSDHQTSMTQNQRRELVRVLSTAKALTQDHFNDPPLSTIELANMNDRQIHLTWQYLCAYITKETYEREFAKCVGPELFLTRPK